MKRFGTYILTPVLMLAFLISLAPGSLAVGWPPDEPDFKVETQDGVQLYFNIIDEGKKTVELAIPDDTQGSSSYSGSINVPETVSYNNEEYTVTAIGERAFKDSKVTSVTLPESITSIGVSHLKAAQN